MNEYRFLDVNLTRKEKFLIIAGAVVGVLVSATYCKSIYGKDKIRLLNRVNSDLAVMFETGAVVAPGREGQILRYQ